MVAKLMRAAALATLTSALGYVVMAYRKTCAFEQQKKLDKQALQEWETDGGGNVAPRSVPAAKHA